MQKAIICDLDSTLADCHHRTHLFDTDRELFDRLSADDLPYPWTKAFLEHMCENHSHEILFVTGRMDSERDRTLQWLERHVPAARSFGLGFNLYMRRDGDYRPARFIKPEIFQEQLQHQYEVVLALDDDPTVCEEYHNLGINVMRVMAQPEYLKQGI